MERLIVILFFIISVSLYATGPSFAEIDIIPVARNLNGDVLCKGYSMLNVDGRHYPVKITFKYIIIFSSGKIEEIDYYVFEPDIYNNEDFLFYTRDYWLSYHEEGINNKLPADLKLIVDKYSFKPLNLNEIKVDKNFKVSDFNKVPIQTTLGGLKSVDSFGYLEVKYIVDDLWFIYNRSVLGSSSINGSYFNLIYNLDGFGNVGFDYFKVTGLLKVK